MPMGGMPMGGMPMGGMPMGGMPMGGGMATNPCAAHGCFLCPPGTHDAGTCQPTLQNCHYNGAHAEMMEQFDHCGGPSQGNPMMGGGMGNGMMGGPGMHGGMGMGNGMMGGP